MLQRSIKLIYCLATPHRRALDLWPVARSTVDDKTKIRFGIVASAGRPALLRSRQRRRRASAGAVLRVSGGGLVFHRRLA